jgi:hypothetical protein
MPGTSSGDFPQKAMTSESPLQRLFLLRAPSAFPNLRFFRRNVGFVKYEDANGKERGVRFGIKGQADSYAITDGGGHIEVEFKAYNGHLSEAQATWKVWCLDHGVPWILLRGSKEESDRETVERWVHEFAILLRDLRAAAGNSHPLTAASMKDFAETVAKKMRGDGP